MFAWTPAGLACSWQERRCEAVGAGSGLPISLYTQAKATAKIRAEIVKPIWLMAEGCGLSKQTVWKRRRRDGVQDPSHTPHGLQVALLRLGEGRARGIAPDAAAAAR